MKIATWNVAGFRKINSLDTWDYSDIDLEYFAGELKKINPDVINLQEVEFANGSDAVKQIADLLDIPYYSEIPMHPSHIGKGLMGYAILSRDKIRDLLITGQPYPAFPLIFKNGKPALKFDKKFVSFTTFNFRCSTLQLQPLQYWGFDYNEEPGRAYGKSLEKILLSEDNEVILGDFQVTTLENTFNYLMLKYMDVLPDTYTRIMKNGESTKADHILIKKGMKAVDAKIIKTKTDHYLCYAEILK